MKTWIIIIAVVIIIICAYFGVKVWCHYIETDIAYSHPMIKFVRKSAKITTITIHSDTKVNIGKADKLELLPNGSYIAFNPIDIALSSSTSVTNHSTEETTENGTSKPIIPPQTHQIAIIGVNIGYSVVFNPNIIETQRGEFNIENWTVGLYTQVIGDITYINYTHVDAYPDVLTFGVGFRIF